MKKLYVIIGLGFFMCSFSMCHKADVFSDDGFDERMSGGASTVLDATSKAFTNSVPGLNTRDQRIHDLGDRTFEQVFVAPPSPIFSGLGPIYNNITCINCHRNDGEGIPTAGFSNSGLLFRISQVGTDAFGGPMAVAGFGTQIQDQAVLGAQPEASINISYTNVAVTYLDGSVVDLRQPTYLVQNPYIALPANCMISPRFARPVFGLGLLENIPESTILSFVDAGDKNGDGISGKANYVYDPYTKKTVLGRFGLKANTSSLLVQVASAYQQDMGVTSYVFPQESAYGQTQMNHVTSDGQPELIDSLINYVTYYMKTLAVPARRNVLDATVKQGQALFNQINCAGCHRPVVQTGIDLTLAQISNQRIQPYTDLLLHDMGAGLADNRPDYLATGAEWRTPPLWGIGLLEKTAGTGYYLHDGRARSLEEAILWHGGEAAKAKQGFIQLTRSDRSKLITFLQSL